jgi:hypothetical protein
MRTFLLSMFVGVLIVGLLCLGFAIWAVVGFWGLT